jgi:hypothetical protein
MNDDEKSAFVNQRMNRKPRVCVHYGSPRRTTACQGPDHRHIASSMRRNRTSVLLQTSLLAVTQAALGCAVGLFLAGKLGRPAQKTTAITMLSVGALIALPLVLDTVNHAVRGPGSERGERRRLDSIRTDSGFQDDAEIF